MIKLKTILFSCISFHLKFVKLIDYILGAAIAWILPAMSNRSLEGNIQRILIIRPGGLGDAVFLLPIIKQLKFLGKHVDVLCENRNKEVFLIERALIDNVYCYNNIIDVWRLSKKPYDVVVDTEQWHFLSAIFAYFIKSSHKIGFDTRQLRSKLFTTAVFYQEDGYELDNFQRLFSFIITNQPAPIISNFLLLEEEQLTWASKQVVCSTVSLSIGASIAARRLKKDQLLEIIKQCFQMNKRVALLGGNDVVRLARVLVKETNDPRLRNYVGKLTLRQSIAVIAKSERFLGVDSGLMHLACAVGVPVVAIFGPGQVKKWAPRGKADQVVSLYMACSPCTKFGYTVPTCNGAYTCMRNIPFAF